MKIEIPIDPADIPTAQEKGVRIVKVNGKHIPMFYKASALVKFEKRLSAFLAPAMADPKNRIPDNTPVYLHITYLFGYPKSTPKSARRDLAPMTQRPDGDNLSKAVIDQLGDRFTKDKRTRKWVRIRKGFFADDAAITPLVISKFRTTGNPRIVIVVKPRPDDNP